MRAFRLPAAMAVCAEPNTHHVIAAIDGCRSFQQAKANAASNNANANANTNSTTISGNVSHRFRLDGLLPEDWSRLLSICRALTDPAGAFNFSSPGDTGGLPPDGSSGAAPGTTVENGAYLHVVRRSPGDFVPNNLVYHYLQQYTTNATSSSSSSSVENSGKGKGVGFRELLRAEQAKPAQSLAEVAAGNENKSASASAEEKRALDPLAGNADAAAKSAANATIDVWANATTTTTTATASSSSSSSSSADGNEQVFTFYPFTCPVAASVPYRSRHFCVMVNLKPIVPNHLMVVPLRCVGTVHALSDEEVEDWGRTVALTMRVLDAVRRLKAGGGVVSGVVAAAGNYSVAVQQGQLAGQTVPHLHTHVIPFDPRGRLAGEPEADEEEQRSRPPRTVDTMREETAFFRPIFRDFEKTL